VIDHAFLESGDYAADREDAQNARGLIRQDASAARRYRALDQVLQGGLDWLPQRGEGLDGIQRYKGWGEMTAAALGNDDGPTQRILLKVQIEDAISAAKPSPR